MVKQRIIEEALKLFISDGVKTNTMDTIAKHMGISKRTIYENFKDKMELLEACLLNDFEKKRKEEQIILASNNVLEAMINYMKREEEAGRRKLKLISEVRRFYPSVHAKITDTCAPQSIERLSEILKLGIKQGLFRSNINPKTSAFLLSAQAMISAHFDKMDIETSGQYEFSIFQAFKDLIINFLRGISTQKGIKVIEANI